MIFSWLDNMIYATLWPNLGYQLGYFAILQLASWATKWLEYWDKPIYL